MTRISNIILAVIALAVIDRGYSLNHVPAPEWTAYKDLYKKVYPNTLAESNAQFYYAYNKKMIESHNNLYRLGRKTFTLKINQFTDMRLIHFNDLFPVAKALPYSNASPPPQVSQAPISYNPATNFGFNFNVEDQGSKCNSGWAYSAVKAVEMLQAIQTGNISPAPLSAQNIIDCSGRTTACQTQVPQTAYDYLTQYNMDLLTQTDYMNNNTLSEPGMCLARGTVVTNLSKYSTVAQNDDESLKNYVGSGFPVVVEFNPKSFEFMHYGEGIYEQPRTSGRGSHFMVVVGYDTDATTGSDYWILQNSFGTEWGEKGLIRMLRSPTAKLANNAIFPSELA